MINMDDNFNESTMPQTGNITFQLIENLRISPIYEELFRYFQIPRSVLYNKIKYEGYDPLSTLKIRSVPSQSTYEVLCGVGRMEVMLRLALESPFGKRSDLKIRCRLVERDDDESCLALILSENIGTKRIFKNYSPLQFYLLYKLLKNFPAFYLSKDYVKYEFDIKESLYQQLNSCYDFIIANLKTKYKDYYEELQSEFTTQPLTEKLQDLKITNHALEVNEWDDLEDFFRDKIKISGFYRKYC